LLCFGGGGVDGGGSFSSLMAGGGWWLVAKLSLGRHHLHKKMKIKVKYV
jgi:hypothetical protein